MTDLTSIKFVKNVLQNRQIYPLKGLGQNFIISKPDTEKLIRAANLTKEDTILEIGAGLGTLTRELSKEVKKSNNRRKGFKTGQNSSRNAPGF